MSSQIITNNTMIKCNQSCALPPATPVPDSGTFPMGAPGSLVVFPNNMGLSNKQPIANINDNKPNVNIMPFASSCQSRANPTVISASAGATAASLGVKMFVSAPCIPVIPAPWSVGSVSCKLKNLSLLMKDSKLNCAMGGIIEISNPAVQNVKNN